MPRPTLEESPVVTLPKTHTDALGKLQEVSLFSGIGGISRGLEAAGVHTTLLCEYDKHARSILQRHYPHAAIHNDVTELTADDCRAAGAVPGRTVLTAGFPCQDLSVAGRRRGLGEGTRSGLYWHVDRLLGEFRPAWVILENVPGLLSATCACRGDGTCVERGLAVGCTGGETHAVPGGACWGECIPRHGGVMGAVLGSLAERGYGFAYRVLDARYFGVPQRRRRVVIVGRLGDAGAAPAQVLLEPEGVPGDPAQSITPRQSAARHARESLAVGGQCHGGNVGAIGTLRAGSGSVAGGVPFVATGILGDHSHTLTATGLDDEAPTLTGRQGSVAVSYSPVVAQSLMSHGGNDKLDPTLMTYVAHQASTRPAAGGDRGYRIDAEGAAGGHLVAFALRGRDDGAVAEVHGDGQQVGSIRASGGGSSRDYVAYAENQRGEVLESATAPALQAAGGGKAGQGYQAVSDGQVVRRLTPLECERLQGYPDGWTDNGQSDSQRYRQLGNSVAVPVFEWVGRRLVAVDDHMGVLA